MPKNDVTAEDAALVGLSDEERAALEESEDDQATLAEIADENDDGGDEDGADAGDDDDAGEDTAQGASGEDTTDGAAGDDTTEGGAGEDTTDGAEGQDTSAGADGDDTVQGATGEDADEELNVPRTMRMKLPDFKPEEYEQAVGTLNEQLAEAAKQFKAGDIEWEDYAAKEQEVRTQRDALNARKVQYDQALAHNEAADQHDWYNTVEAFKRQARRTGVDYDKATVKVGGKDEKLLDVFDRTVKALANDPANAQRDALWFLQEADAMVRARFRLATAAPAKGDDANGKDAKAKALKGRRPNLRTVPKTLGGLPAAGATETGVDDGEFAHLENLSGMELEAALARLTPDQARRYLEQAA